MGGSSLFGALNTPYAPAVGVISCDEACGVRRQHGMLCML